MSKSTMVILVILFSRIIFDEEDEMFSLDQWGQCPSRAATVHDMVRRLQRRWSLRFGESRAWAL